MKFDEMFLVIREANKRFYKISRLREKIALMEDKKNLSIQNRNKEILDIIEKKTEDFLTFEIDKYINKLDDAVNLLLDTLNEELREKLIKNQQDFTLNESYNGDNLQEQYKNNVIDLIVTLNERIEELNNIDFNALDPTYEIVPKNEKYWTTFIYNDSEIKYNFKNLTFEERYRYIAYDKINDIVSVVNTLKKKLLLYKNSFVNDIKKKRFDMYLSKKSDEWIEKDSLIVNNVYKEIFNNEIVKENDVIKKDRLENFYSEAKNGSIDENYGSSVFSEQLTLGQARMNFLHSDSYNEYIEKSPVLKEYVTDGKINFPIMLNLKNEGNILLDINQDDNYENELFSSIHSIILNFLFAFPAGRFNMCFVDVDDKGDFSHYARLKQINDRILFNGIIRDESQIDSTIKEMEKHMNDVYENQISYNNSENLFEYNKKSITNPQSFHLLVILNFPNGFRNETLTRLRKIIMQGNRSGIFTFIVNNKNSFNTSAVQKDKIDEFLNTIKKKMLHLKYDNKKLSILEKISNKDTQSEQNEFILQNNLQYSKIYDYVKILDENSKKTAKISIELTKMFEFSDEDKKNTSETFSEVIDIPIGMRGGEMQDLRLSSLGDGSAHCAIIGGTGSGKSNLLHTIIMSACYRYSPDEFILYIVDFKGGVEFKYYEADHIVEKQLPHVKLTGLTSDPEDGVAILDNIKKELRRREDYFRKHNVEDIVQYNLKYKDKILPRMLVIIDEVQELFERNESLGQYAINVMSELFKKGRAFGISILWASQNVPKIASLRDKVISQIGNRICLRLNNIDDATDLDIDSKQVKNLNRPEKGLGIVKDNRTGNDCVEFRVAYAETAENRRKYSDIILNKWKNVTNNSEREPLYVVGNGEIAKADIGKTKFTYEPKASDIKDNSNGHYSINIGQDYITGSSFNIDINLRGTKSNLWMAGASTDELRNMMGYSLLSVILENKLNKSIKSKNIYYVNGELKDSSNSEDLYYVLPDLFSENIEVIDTQNGLSSLMIKLLKIRRERAEIIQKEYEPIFVFINKLQVFADMFKDVYKLYDLDEENNTKENLTTSSGFNFNFSFGNNGGNNSSQNNKMSFQAMFNELLSRGSDCGIHFVFSMNTPSSISEIEKELKTCANKVFIRGVRQEDTISMLNNSRQLTGLSIEGLGYAFINNDMNKFKIYKYNPTTDKNWLLNLIDKYKNLK